MAKQLINTAINARSKKAAISACNQAMNPFTADGERKTGKEAMDAFRLREAAKQSGLKFADVHDDAIERHRPIAPFFGKDEGMRLMRMDSSIAIDILYHFAKRGVPCLSVHDSFIVPANSEAELRRVMIEFYQQKTGFPPVVKK